MNAANWPDLAGYSAECREAVLLGQPEPGGKSRHWDCTDPACRCTCRNCERKTRDP